jgi:hypothetical protein
MTRLPWLAQQLVDLAVSTVRGVVYGILGSLLAQGILAGVGFLVAGVPGALFLGFLTLFLSILPGGPALLWLPASIWLKRYRMGYPPGLAWLALPTISSNPISRPRQRSPFILVLLKCSRRDRLVIGIFLGPTLLAVGGWSGTGRWPSPLPLLPRQSSRVNQGGPGSAGLQPG